MCLEKKKIPAWKEREEQFKKQSFDNALELLGISQKLIQTKKVKTSVLIKEKV